MEQKVAIPPLEVKASIKLVRWVCLVSGIIHGIVKKREYGAIERVLREEEERERPAREARERCEKSRRDAAVMRELERIILGTSSTETEEPNEIPCNETITSKDNSSALNDKKRETVISPDNKSEETNDKVVSKDKSEETSDKVLSKDESEEAVISSDKK